MEGTSATYERRYYQALGTYVSQGPGLRGRWLYMKSASRCDLEEREELWVSRSHVSVSHTRTLSLLFLKLRERSKLAAAGGVGGKERSCFMHWKEVY